MNILKSFTLNWWQLGIFKITVLAFGIAIGTYWHEFFSAYLPILILIAVVCGLYIASVWWKQ